MRYIVRWSLMRNALPENIQEHSHMVAVIAHALGVIRRDVMGVPVTRTRRRSVALFHDSSEILTGDLPTPIKYHSEEIQKAYRQVENLACNMLLATPPDELRGLMSPLYGRDARANCTTSSRRRISSRRTSSASRSARRATTSSFPPRSRTAPTSTRNPLPEVKYFYG